MNLFNLGSKRCIHRQDIKHHPNCFDADGNPKKEVARVAAKVLVLDVETLPILGYSWGVWNQNIYPNQIIKDWCLLSYSAKWLGDDRIISDVLTSKEAKERDDSRITNGAWKLLDEADIVITHNGKRFDIRKLNTRFWKNKLHKPSSYKIIDTLTTARSVFGLTYNKLDFIAKFVGADEKLETDFELWASCDKGDRIALDVMKAYNEQDVFTLEEIYINMREWIPNHPDMGVYQGLKDVCPVCVSPQIKEIGIYTADKKRFPEFRCEDCGSTWHSSVAIKKEKETK